MSTSQSANRLSVLKTVVPALMAIGLMGSVPNWVNIAQAQGYYTSGAAALKTSANVMTVALANKSAIGMAIGSRTGSGGRSTAGGFRINGVRFGNVELNGTLGLDEDSAAGGSTVGQLGGFLTGVGGFGDQDGTDGFDYTNGGLIGGVDYQFSEALVGGLSINWINTDTDYFGGGGSSDRDTYGASLYASYSVDSVNIDALFNYSFSDYALTRAISPTITATGINNSDEIFLSAGVDYEFDVSGFAVKPGVRLDLVKVWMDAYTETGAGVDNVSYNAFDVTSFTTDLGGEVSYACKIGAGMITPRLYGYWVHEYQDDVQALAYSVGGGVVQTVLTDSPDRNYGRVGAGASLDLQGGLEIYVDYQALVGFDRINSHQFAAGGRFEF